jgi:phosphoglycolate phosphatase
MKKSQERVFFTDLDGTLEDSRQDMANAVVEARKSLGLEVDDFETYVPFVNKGMKELSLNCFTELLEGLEPAQKEAKALECQAVYESKYLEKIAVYTKPYKGIFELLQALSSMGKVVVITNKPHHLSIALLKQIRLLDFIALVVGGDSCGHTKPSSFPLEWALAQLGIDKSNVDAFMMGDTAADIHCGKSFGAKTLWCAYGYSSHPGALEPDHVVTSPEEALKLLRFLVSGGEERSLGAAEPL